MAALYKEDSQGPRKSRIGPGSAQLFGGGSGAETVMQEPGSGHSLSISVPGSP